MPQNEKNIDAEYKQKVSEELKKRERYKQEADYIIKKINQKLEEQQEDIAAIDVERIDLINKIRKNLKTKDIDQLEKLFERLE